MTNTTLLRQKIDESGYKLQFLAEKCGLTYYGLMKKVNNETEFNRRYIASYRGNAFIWCMVLFLCKRHITNIL